MAVGGEGLAAVRETGMLSGGVVCGGVEWGVWKGRMRCEKRRMTMEWEWEKGNEE